MSDIDVFKLPYFLTAKNGERHSRACVLLTGLARGAAVGWPDGPPEGARLALHDLVAASRAMDPDDDAQRLLSEAVLSALSLGLRMAVKPSGAALAAAIDDARKRERDAAAKARSEAARRGHEPHTAARAEAIAWYVEHRAMFTGKGKGGKDAAAIALTKILTYEFSTIRGWLKNT